MPSLLELLGNLKNFKYYTGTGNFNQNNLPIGGDRPGGGSSNQPYIKKPLYVNDVTGVSNAVSHAAVDTLRISKFLLDVPRGPLFLANQVGLQLMNPEVEHKQDFTTTNPTNRPTKGQGFFNNVKNISLNTANKIANQANAIENRLGSNRIFNPTGANLLAQVAGSAFGKHIPRQGFNLEVSETDKYPYIAKINNLGEGSPNNRLVKFLNTEVGLGAAAEGKRMLYSYTGGPNSFLGIGKTVINSYYSVFEPGNTTSLSLSPYSILNINNNAELGQVDQNTLATGGQSISLRTTDYAAVNRALKDSSENTTAKLSRYKTYNTHKRIGVINPGNPVSYASVPNDVVNMISLFYHEGGLGNVNTKDINDNDVSPAVIRDMIKFRIKAIDNDNPGAGIYMIFRAFLNSFSDSMGQDHNSVKYIGRGETFYAYTGFTETYSISFTIAALSKEEMKPLYQKLNYLKSTFAPDYKANKMRGNFVEMTVGDYLKYQPGIINSINITVPDGAQWEIAMDEPELGVDQNMHELPQALKVELQFTPVYNFLPRKSSRAPFIGINDSEQSNSNQHKDDKEWLTPNLNSKFTK